MAAETDGHIFQVNDHLVEVFRQHAHFVVALDIDRLVQVAGFADPAGDVDQMVEGSLMDFAV